MITAMLAIVVIGFLFYSRIPPAALVLLCVGLGLFFASAGRHRHTQLLAIDVLAQSSRLQRVNPTLKFWTALSLMVICISAQSAAVGVFLTVAVLFITVRLGGLAWRDYVNLLSLPVLFLLVSGLALLFESSAEPSGVINIPVFHFWICVSGKAQLRTALVISRALGAVSCLYFLSLSTPMSELIGVLRGAHCPPVCIDLMYLIYRYIFILFSMYHAMRAAANSRLGNVDTLTSIRTAGSVYANLLARSYRQAGRHFDAMESRCYDAEIRFLESRKDITGIHTTAAVGVVVFTFILSLLLR